MLLLLLLLLVLLVLLVVLLMLLLLMLLLQLMLLLSLLLLYWKVREASQYWIRLTLGRFSVLWLGALYRKPGRTCFR